jgi:hypothetical protein
MKKMIVFLLSLLLFIPISTCMGQDSNRYLTIKAEVIRIPESSFDNEKEPLAFSYIILTYKVLKVCKGEYVGDEIKIAHGVTSRKKLKVGDEVTLEVNPTNEFREIKEILQESGTIRSEESIADYIFVEFKKSDLCL